MAREGETGKETDPVGLKEKAVNQWKEADPVGLKEKAVNQWLKIKEHAETYPYVWGSYILVYGGMGAYFAYRWRKLRRTEDRVRILQGRLRKLVEEEESESASALGSSGPPPSMSSRPVPSADRSS